MTSLRRTILALLFALPAATFALERTALIPPDAQTYVHLSDSTAFLAKLKVSSIGKLWADRQFQDFIGNPDKDDWQELFFQGDRGAEEDVFIEQLKMLKGEVIMAFLKDRENPCIIAAMSKEDFLRSLVMDEKLTEVMKEPFKIVRSTFQDVEIIQHIEHAGTPDENPSWQAHLNNTLILGHTREWVEKSIVRLNKESIEEPKGNPVLNINLPLATIIREKLADGTDPQGSPDREALLDALGLLGIEGFSARIELKDDEMMVDNTLKATSLGKGIFTLLDLAPSELPTVGFIPENITSLEVGRFNLLRFWQEIPAVISTAMPAMKPQFDMILGMIRQQVGVDVEQDLLTNLGTKYISFTVPENDQLVSVIAIELKDSQAFKRGLETALAAPALQPQVAVALDVVDFLGHTLYITKNTAPGDTLSLAVSGNHLLYGHPDGIRQVIRSVSTGTKQAFEQTALVQGLRQQVPPTAFGYSVIDWRKNMTFIIREITKPERIEQIQQKWATSGSPLPPPDFKKLPPTDHIASFFNLTYQYVEKTPAGLHQRIILKY